MLHFAWVPQDRKTILEGKLAERLKELLEECAEVNGWKIEELNIHPDHVHIVVHFVLTVSVCEMIERFKKGSSKILLREFPELQGFLLADGFWAEGFFAATAGEIDEEKMKQYLVENQ